MRLADGYFPGEGDHERLGALLQRLRQAAEAEGRDPASIEINAMFGTQMMDPLAGRTDKPDRLPRVPGSGRRWLPAGHWIAAGLLLASAAQAAEPQPANIDLFQRPAMQADLTGLERLILTGRTGHAERAIRQRLRRFASVADYHYLLAY